MKKHASTIMLAIILMSQALSTWLVGHFSMVLRGQYELVYLAVPMVILVFVFANPFNIVGMDKDFLRIWVFLIIWCCSWGFPLRL